MKYYMWVLGCAMNSSDAERIASVLELLGYQKTEVEKEADLIVTVACSVRQHAIDRIYGSDKKWQRLKKQNPKLKTVLTGCVLAEDRAKMAKIFDLMFEIDDLGKLPELLGTSQKNSNDVLGKSGEYLKINPNYESTFRAYVPIMTGCNNFCTYCAVPYTRGKEKSRPAAEVIAEVKTLVKKGYKEISLLGQNVNSYGNDLTVIPTGAEESLKVGKGISRQARNDNFVSLLKQIDKISGDFRIYFYSNHPKDMSEELIKILPKLGHFPEYLHLPLQSGNDEILRQMNRHYTKKSYLELVAKIRKAMPKVVLTTDIIVGFPGEGKKEFADTMDVVKKAGFEMIYIGQYSPRPGTISAKLPDVISKAEKKKREGIITDLLAKNLTDVNQKLVGTTEKVLIDGQKGGKFFGRTEGYKVVEIANYSSSKPSASRSSNKDSSRQDSNNKLKLGQFVNVKIKSATAWKLKASLV